MSTVANSDDGLSRMVQNPKRYFAEARARAAAQVDAEMKRVRQRSQGSLGSTRHSADHDAA
jgi:hypothetical protein